jgi:hypothetical protein
MTGREYPNFSQILANVFLNLLQTGIEKTWDLIKIHDR